MSRFPLRLFQILLVVAGAALFVFLGWKEFAPTGHLTLSSTVGTPSPFWSRVLPDTRTEEVYEDADSVAFQPIVGDPTYVTLTPPSDFDDVTVELEYKNTGASVVELGLLTNAEADAYHLEPLENQLLDGLDWTVVREGDVVLYDRHGRYQTVADFLVDAPPLSEIASYHYAFDRSFSLPGYTPNSELRTLDVSLRGEHEFLTYLENERLSFSFDYRDMNRTLGADSVTVLVFDRAGTLVASKAVEDDGDESAGGKGSERRSLSVSADLPDGVYKVILKVNRDIFFRRITTTQQKLTFLNQIFLGDEVGYQPAPRSATFVTEAKSLSLETQHAEGVQEVNIAGVVVEVAEPFVTTRHRVRAPGLVSATVPKGDLLIRGAGHYAFSRAMYFNPDPVRLEGDTDLSALGVNYVIATYTPPVEEGDLVKARATFSLRDVPKVRGAWKFALSLPDVEEQGGGIDLHALRAELVREPLTFRSFFEKVWTRLLSGGARAPRL